MCMCVLETHEVWEMKPRKLTAEEVDCPEKVIEEFFQFAHLPQVRSFMWEGVKTMVTGNFAQLRTRDRVNLLYFYEQMEKLIEGVHVMHESRRAQSA